MISIDDKQINKIVKAVEKQGYAVLSSVVPTKIVHALEKRIHSLQASDLKAAGIGRGDLQQSNLDIRRDKIQWLDEKNVIDNAYLNFMESLRTGLNQALYLGLFDYESHYAVYQKGDFYKQHVDALKGTSNRVVSTVLYLNEQWTAADGGELVLYSEDGKTILETVTPNAGTLVIFLSEQFPHEVLAANATRYSIAGWFRVNASNSQTIDTIS